MSKTQEFIHGSTNTKPTIFKSIILDNNTNQNINLTLESILPTKEQLDFYKNEYKDYVKAEYPNCDKYCIDLLKFFNKYEGIATIFSCQGHYEDIIEDHQYMYFQFCVNINGYLFLINLFNKYLNNCFDYKSINAFKYPLDKNEVVDGNRLSIGSNYHFDDKKLQIMNKVYLQFPVPSEYHFYKAHAILRKTIKEIDNSFIIIDEFKDILSY